MRPGVHHESCACTSSATREQPWIGMGGEPVGGEVREAHKEPSDCLSGLEGCSGSKRCKIVKVF